MGGQEYGDKGGDHERGLRTLGLEQPPRDLKLGGGVAGGHEAVVANLHEAAGQDVLQEAMDEFVGREGRGGFAASAEVDAVVGEREQALIGDPDAVRVSAEVAEDLFGPGEGLLAVGDPLLLVEPILELGEGLGGFQFRGQIEDVRLVGGDEPVHQLAAEQLAENLGGEEVILTTSWCPQWSHSSTRPPKTGVRQTSMARIALRFGSLSAWLFR